MPEDRHEKAQRLTRIASHLAEQILAGFAAEGATVEVDALPDGSGVTLSTDAAAPSEDAVTAPAAEA